MKKNLFRIIASVLVVSMLMSACNPITGISKEPGNGPGATGGVEPKVFVMDISENTDWDYLVVGADGSSMFFNIDKTTGIPTRAYVKPKKDSDAGSTWLFKDNGLPDTMIVNDHIVYFGNFNGYTFDLAIIKPDGTIEYHYDNQTDVNWDTFDEVFAQGGSVQRSSVQAARGVSDVLNYVSDGVWLISTGIGVASCIAALFIPVLWAECGAFVLSQAKDLVIEFLIEAIFDDDVSSSLLVAKAAWDCFSDVKLLDCVSFAADFGSLIFDQDRGQIEDKALELEEAKETIEFIYTPPYVAVTGVTLYRSAISLTVGDVQTLYLTILPNNATKRDITVTWSSSNESVATTSNGSTTTMGYVYAVAEGTATITAAADTNEGRYTASCTVTVLPPVAVTGVTLDKAAISLTVGEHERLHATVLPADAKNKDTEWTTSNNNIATVSNGNVHAVAKGTATITVTTKDGNYTASCTVTVTAAPADLNIEMVFVSGGSFEMGKNLGTAGYWDVTPIHTVTLSGFYMGKYEVTQAQYQAVMGLTQAQQQALALSPSTTDYGRGDNYPVYYVSWYDAIAFCNKLSIAKGLTPAYRISGSTDPAAWGTVPESSNSTWDAATIVAGSTGYRLPTEAQWEYAAKGGSSSGNYTFAGSNTIGDVAWSAENSNGMTHEVGKKASNRLGIYDMCGNVFEWCGDWRGNYTNIEQANPVGPSFGDYRVLRGGSWESSAQYAFLANRNYNSPSFRLNYVGFRLVRP